MLLERGEPGSARETGMPGQRGIPRTATVGRRRRLPHEKKQDLGDIECVTVSAPRESVRCIVRHNILTTTTTTTVRFRTISAMAFNLVALFSEAIEAGITAFAGCRVCVCCRYYGASSPVNGCLLLASLNSAKWGYYVGHLIRAPSPSYFLRRKRGFQTMVLPYLFYIKT